MQNCAFVGYKKINRGQFNKYVFVSVTVSNLYTSVFNIGFTTFYKTINPSVLLHSMFIAHTSCPGN